MINLDCHFKANQDRTGFDFAQSGLKCHPGSSVPIVTTTIVSLRDVEIRLTGAKTAESAPTEEEVATDEMGNPLDSFGEGFGDAYAPVALTAPEANRDPSEGVRYNESRKVESLKVNGVDMQYSNRFATSLAGLIGQSRSIFRLFDPAEVVERAIASGVSEKVRIAFVEDEHSGVKAALAVTSANSPLVQADELVEVLAKYGVGLAGCGYHDGVLTTVTDPSMPAAFAIKGDEMLNKLMLHIPLDGYGSPVSYLAIIRAVCANLCVYMDAAFKSSIQLGRTAETSPIPAIDRFIKSFNSEEGFAKVAERLAVAAQTPASANELYKVIKVLKDLGKGKHADGVIPAAWNSLDLRDNAEITPEDMDKRLRAAAAKGNENLMEAYRYYMLDQASARARSAHATKMSVYDLCNFGTEVATHYMSEGARRLMNHTLGTMLADEGGYDFEGADLKLPDGAPQDLFLRKE